MLKASFPTDVPVEHYLEGTHPPTHQKTSLPACNPNVSLAELDYWSASEVFIQSKNLAMTILPIPEIASQVAYDAMLAAQLCRNKQYNYRKSWLKNNRYKKYGPTKALLHKNQLVQNFVYRELERYEKYNEGDLTQAINNSAFEEALKNFPLSEENLIIRYIKFLVQIAEDNPSNSVLAKTKLIYKYRTTDVAEIYTRLHGDGPVDNYFSKRKGEFVRRLEERFQSLIALEILKIIVGNKREKYFQGQEIFDDKWANLVKETFKNFTPWGTKCLAECSKSSYIENFFIWIKSIFNEDQKKMASIHTLFCPDCFNKLIKDLNLANPTNQLALPDFNLPSQNAYTMNHFDPQNPITQKTEIRNVLNKLNDEVLRREQLISSGIKNIFITCNEQKILDFDLLKERKAHLTIKDLPLTAKPILKIYSVDRKGDLLLATILLDKPSNHWLSFFNEKTFPILEGKQKLVLTEKYLQTTPEEGLFIIEIYYNEVLFSKTTHFWHQYSTIMQSVWLK